MEPEPETEPLETANLFCFLDSNRACGADCMAYITFPRGQSPELSEPQQHCLFLLSAERLTRHVTIVASTLNALERRKKVAEDDLKRASAVPAFVPYGEKK